MSFASVAAPVREMTRYLPAQLLDVLIDHHLKILVGSVLAQNVSIIEARKEPQYLPQLEAITVKCNNHCAA